MSRPLRSLASALLLTVAAALPARAQARPPFRTQTDTAGLRRMHEVSGAMIRAIFARLHQNGAGHLDGWLEMRGDSAHTTVTPRLVGSTVPDPVLRGVPDLMVNALAAWPAQMPVIAGFRLDAEDAFADRQPVQIPGSERQPRVTNRNHVLEGMEAVVRASGISEAELAAGVHAQLLVLVGTDGRPLLVQVLLPTGRAEFDEYLLPLGYEMRFRPAAIGGTPVRVYVCIPIAFGIRGIVL